MKSIILGINCGHDSTACLIKEGNILAAVAEERLTKNKLHIGFPWLAIKEVLCLSKVSPSEIDVVVVPHNDYLKAHPFYVNLIMHKERFAFDIGNEFDFLSLLRETLFQLKTGGSLSFSLAKTVGNCYARNAFITSQESLGIHAELASTDHHMSHAASAYFTSGYEECLIITADGSGDGLSHTTSIGKNGIITRLYSTDEKFSPGVFYSAITKYLGFKRHKHEGKITGLAAYGDPKRLYPFFSDVLCLSENKSSYFTKLNYNFPITKKTKWVFRIFSSKYFRSNVMNYLLDLFNIYLAEESPENIAAAAQKVLEDTTIALIGKAISETAMKKIVLSGGVFGNVKLNQKILDIKGVKEIYIHPNMGDGGCALGGALLFYSEECRKVGKIFMPERIKHVYWGPEYTDDEIHSEISKNNLLCEYSKDVELETAKYISRGFIVGRFNGRMEYGPRALGNRSILARANDKNIPKILNKRLNRSDFMPFAPSILYEYITEYFENVKGAEFALEFMTITCKLKDKYKDAIPAVTHVDLTARPHIVRKEINESYYNILREYLKITGLPVILNTSFNYHEHPIVCSPKDAIQCFLQNYIDVLSIGNFIIKQPHVNCEIN